jgi:hypothetical protein
MNAMVSEMARQAAAAFVLVGSGFASVAKDALAETIERGEADDHWVTQAFHRFEAAIRADQVERDAKVADGLDLGEPWSTADNCSRFHTRNAIATAIRQKGQP